jgi:elongation factor P
MKISANSIRQGNILEYKGRLWSVLKQPEHTMPGKGGAFIQVEMKDIKNGTKLNERFRSTEYVEKARLDEKEYQFLFADENFINLMDLESFDQIQVNINLLGDRKVFLQDNMMVTLESYQDEHLNVKLPEHVTLKVVESEPVIKGQTATASFKPATLENGVRVMVPPFITPGTNIVIRTEDNSYIERAKN